MRCIINGSNDPALSLAAEEYLLTEKTDGDWLMLWISRPSIIVGKFQNVYGEVSISECERAGVPIFRRNSGGGTVYHDSGNLNYTVVTDRSDNSLDYARFLEPVVDFLASLGVKADIADTSALFVGDKKISGNAQSTVGVRVMHHGTLLFDADLDALHRLTGHAREKIKSKSIASKPSPVTNIRPLLTRDMTLAEFEEKLASALSSERCNFSGEEMKKIESLAEEKYRTWTWNFGRSPAFTLLCDGLELTARHGVIEASSVYNDVLAGVKLIPDEIKKALSNTASVEEIERITNIIFD